MHNEIDDDETSLLHKGHAEILNNHNKRLARLEEAHKDILSAFPIVDGKTDLDNHRIHHEDLITKAAKRTKLWDDIKKQILTSGLWVTIIWFGSSGWEFVKFKLGIK